LSRKTVKQQLSLRAITATQWLTCAAEGIATGGW
jgi:hypothetical protein